jgi:hypothetical protein
VPIPGTTKLQRLEENIRAASVQLTANDLAEIERTASAITVKGERSPEHLLATTGGQAAAAGAISKRLHSHSRRAAGPAVLVGLHATRR